MKTTLTLLICATLENVCLQYSLATSLTMVELKLSTDLLLFAYVGTH